MHGFLEMQHGVRSTPRGRRPGFSSKLEQFEKEFGITPEMAARLNAEANESHDGYLCPYCDEKTALNEFRDRDILEATECSSFKRKCEKCSGNFLVHVYPRKHFISATNGGSSASQT